MLVDFLDPCPECDGRGDVLRSDDFVDRCPSCVGGRVVSESVIEEMGRVAAEALDDEGFVIDHHAIGITVEAAARVVLEHMEDNERTTG